VITPIVDDPETFGRIAATNSISDIYAMGGRPLLSLSVACFNPKLPTDAMGGILAGAASVALEAGAPVLGGHTIKDDEVKFGLAVIGEIHPDRILRSAGAADGEVLIITKSIGSAALATAFKQGVFDEDDPRYRSLVDNMLLSNRRASEIAVEASASCATDITGFGLSGHLLEVADASSVGIDLDFGRIPFLSGAREALEAGHTCGGAEANERYAGQRVSKNHEFPDPDFKLLFDPQTAGPLIFSIRAEQADIVIGMLKREGYSTASAVGRITKEHCGSIQVI
jgi:selenide,water dikinase